MADFTWDYIYVDMSTSIDGGEFISVTIEATSVDLATSVEGSVSIWNAVGTKDVDLTVAISGQFVPTYRGRNVVKWSDIGSVDFVLSDQNLAGWKALEWEGYAWKGLRFKNAVIVYGSGGISVLFPISDPISTWSEHVLDSGGILSKDAVCDTDLGHVFIGRDKQLYIVTEDSKSLKSTAIPVIKLVGFKEFIETLQGNIQIFYEPVTKVTYIAGTNATLLISQSEVTQVTGSISGAIYTDELYHTQDSVSSTLVSLRTQELRFGTTNFKTIRSIAFDFDMSLVDSPVCIVYMRDKTTKDFTTTKRCKITKDGQAFPNVTTQEFQIGIEFTPLERLAVRNMQLTIQFSDKRFGYGGSDVKQVVA